MGLLQEHHRMVPMVLYSVLAIIIISIQGQAEAVGENNVTYDGRSLIINGQHRILFSGSIHYPRSTPEVSLMQISFPLSSYTCQMHMFY